jgi:hypothetical protein
MSSVSGEIQSNVVHVFSEAPRREGMQGNEIVVLRILNLVTVLRSGWLASRPGSFVPVGIVGDTC